MKKQKSTYTARREEAQHLRLEVERLTSELQELQLHSSSPQDAVLLDPEVTENRLLKSVAKSEQMKVAAAQSLLTASLGPQESHPLYTRICLTKDWGLRRQTLMTVRRQKLQNAYDFLMAPGRFTELDKPTTSFHLHETTEGDICGVHTEVLHFPGVESLEKVWEAVMFHYNNIEMDISEKLGHTTIRDDYDSIDGSVHNIRVLSQSEHCTAVESSIVTFSHLFTDADNFRGQRCGVLALDCIDEDELYPYFPDERVRLDTSGAIVLTENQPTPTSSEGSELVVTLRRAAFVRLHSPQFPLSEAVRQELQAGVGRWGEVLMNSIRGYVYGVP